MPTYKFGYKKGHNYDILIKKDKIMVKDLVVKKITAFDEKHQLIPPNSHLIIGLSGGPDSVFLLHYFLSIATEKNLTLTAAHLNHQWRPHSANDVKFCQDLCQRWGVGLVVESLQNISSSFKFNGSHEEMGRHYRRVFFEQVRKEYNAQFIALAHHADDQTETFFIRLLRGSSLAGLTGMKPRENFYIRPLLSVSKEEIVHYLAKKEIPYLIDPTNASDTFLRNRIRSHIIPALRTCDARFDTTFTQTLGRLQETEDFLKQITQQTLESISKEKDGHLQLHIPSFLGLHSVLQYRLLIAWFCCEKVPFPVTQAFLNEVVRFFQHGKKDTHEITQQWQLECHNEWAVIMKRTTA